MNSEFPPGIVTSTGHPLDAQGETTFLQRLFGALENQMGDNFRNFTFVVHRRVAGELAGRPIKLDPGGPHRVLIVIADEKEVFPVEDYQDYRHVFRAYGNPDGTLCHPFPVGYHNAAGTIDPVPFDKRHHSVFFSGYLNRNRVDIYKQFQALPWLPARNLPGRHLKEAARRMIERFYPARSFRPTWPGSRIDFTEWFGKGLEPGEYAKVLADTKIALCPPGFISHETIRHWEAMRLGCVVISAPLPPNRFYHGSPILQLADWSQLRPLLDSLLADPGELHRLHEKTVDWWEQRCSEHAVADYMAKVLEGER